MRVMISAEETLLSALQRGQVHIDAPCNGNGTCGRCEVTVYGLGKVQACQFARPGIYEVTIPKQHQFDSVGTISKETELSTDDLDLTKDIHCPENQTVDRKGVAGDNAFTAQLSNHTVAAVDIGTTTVAGLKFTGVKKEAFSYTNPQRMYGADVMSRIKAANEGKLRELQRLLVEQLDSCIGDCEQVVISANTTMNHMLQGLSCEGLGQAPFEPVDISLHKVKWEELREDQCNHSVNHRKQNPCMTFLPSISTFVGGDIVSGIYKLDMIHSEKPILLVDLGTNGEMALGNKERILVASTAAGPAFEGNDLALYIHGSGIMKVLHEMLDNEAMDESGLLNDEFFQEGYPVAAGITRDRNQSEEQSGYSDSSADKGAAPLRMTQEIIRDVQMAKAAIHAGIEILLKEFGISASDVDKICLAGGMGYYLDPNDALAIGLLPIEFQDRIQAAGNTSLDGAIRYLNEVVAEEILGSAENGIMVSDHESMKRAASSNADIQQIKALSREIILANNSQFEELYIKAMNFPAKEKESHME